VSYEGAEKPGTIIINTPERLLYLVEPGGKALRYGILGRSQVRVDEARMAGLAAA
jgi:lipoprotein-anchoring transpeptidase ErfK/SrfK